MKKLNLKNILSLAASAALVLSLTACTGSTTGGNTASPTPPATAAVDPDAHPVPSSSPAASQVKIGVIQFAPHPSLDNCYSGFVQGLAEAGYVEGQNLTIDFQNAQGEPSNADLMAKNMAAAQYDMVVGVATPAAMSAYAAARDAGIPVVFTAVSDPIAAGLAQTLEAPSTGATGTSDALNLDGQLKMIRALLPEAKKIGILYTTSEPNSVSNLENFKALAPNYGFTVEAVGITNASEVASGAATLIAKGVDCVNNFTDNNVVNQLSTLLHATDEAGIPVFGSEIEQVKNGCVASESLDYVALGVETGKMAGQLLDGSADAKTLPVQIIADSEPVYSAAHCTKFGITIPEDYAKAINVDE